MDYDNIEIMRRWTLLDQYSFFNAVFFCSLFSVVLWLFCRKTSWMVRLGLKPLCLFVFLAVLRLVFPIELPFVQIVGSRKILVWVQRGFRIRLAQLGGHSIETGDVFLFVWLWGAALLLGRFLWPVSYTHLTLPLAMGPPWPFYGPVPLHSPGDDGAGAKLDSRVPGPGASGSRARDALCGRLFPPGDLSAGCRL